MLGHLSPVWCRGQLLSHQDGCLHTCIAWRGNPWFHADAEGVLRELISELVNVPVALSGMRLPPLMRLLYPHGQARVCVKLCRVCEQRAALRKLRHELGIAPEALSARGFRFLTRLLYCAPDHGTYGPGAEWGEHEVSLTLRDEVLAQGVARRGAPALCCRRGFPALPTLTCCYWPCHTQSRHFCLVCYLLRRMVGRS